MTIMDRMMGRTEEEVMEEFEKSFLKEVAKVEIEKSENKQKRMENRLRKKFIKFVKGLYNLGIEVYKKESNKKRIECLEDIKDISLQVVYRDYVFKTIREIKEEINRRARNE